MLKRFFPAVLCSVILIGEFIAGSVIVAREKKAERPAQIPQPPACSDHVSNTTLTESRRMKSAPAALTLEEMRRQEHALREADERSVPQSQYPLSGF